MRHTVHAAGQSEGRDLRRGTSLLSLAVRLCLLSSGMVLPAVSQRASRTREPLIQPGLSLSQSVRKIGIRKLIRQGFGRRIIEKISRRELVKASTYREYERRLEEYARRRQRPRHSL